MNEFWDQASRRNLKAMEEPGWEYPGDAAIFSEVKRKKAGNRGRKVVFRLCVAAAVAAALGVGSFAAYEYWHMPKDAETYTGDMIRIHETQTYTVPSAADPDTTEPVETEMGTSASIAERLNDEWFIGQAVEVLTIVNKMPVDAAQLTVTRQKNQHWDREEVMVSLPGDSGTVDVTFDAADGVLIHVTAFDEPYSEGEALSDADALALAQEYYDSLPYARGYEFRDVTEYDEDMWMYSFSKPYEIEGQTVYSPYEQVRITINPLNGHFQLSNCFYVPLLTEHDPNVPALTMEQARQIVERCRWFNPAWLNYDCTASLGIVLPSPGSVPDGDTDDAESDHAESDEQTYIVSIPTEITGYVAYTVTRPAWVFTYDGEYIIEGEDVGFADGGTIAVDLYTGEILSFAVYA